MFLLSLLICPSILFTNEHCPIYLSLFFYDYEKKMTLTSFYRYGDYMTVRY